MDEFVDTNNPPPVDDEDDEYEDTYVMLEFPSIEGTCFLDSASNYSISGLDTANPTLEIDGNTFTGMFEDSLETTGMFEVSDDKIDPSKRCAKYVCKTSKKLKFTLVAGPAYVALKKKTELAKLDIKEKKKRKVKRLVAPLASSASSPSSSSSAV